MVSETPHLSDETLIRAADGELPAGQCADVERHLASCDSCAARQRQLRLALQAFVRGKRADDSSAPPVSDAFRARVQANVMRLSSHPAGRSWPRRLLAIPRERPGRTAAVAAIAAAAALVAMAAVTRFGAERAATDDAMLAVQTGALPVPSLTPGATRPVQLAELCSGGAPVERPIAVEVRQAVLRDYRMEGVPAHEYELDYLITPELGGSDDRLNLWPERYGARVWNARVKDELERLLPGLVCRGDVDLQTAQRDIAANWIAAYKKYFHSDRPVGMHGARTPAERIPALVSLLITAPAVPRRTD